MKYEATENQMENLKLKDDFLLSGDGVFHTIQGEGDMVGVPTTFVRLHLCNLNCSWCDTPYTWDREDPRFYEEPIHINGEQLRDLIHKAQEEKGLEQYVNNIVFTGGEPLIQQKQIVKYIRENPNDFYQIETNGTIAPSDEMLELVSMGIVKFNCSPKLSSAGMKIGRTLKPEVLNILDNIPTTIFKFVCSTEDDIKEIESVYLPYISKKKIMIMPEGISEEANNKHLQQMIDIIIKKGFRITPRLQTTLFQNRRKT